MGIMAQLPALIVVTPLLLAFLVYLVGIFRPRLSYPLVLLGTSLSFIFSLGILYQVLHSSAPVSYHLGGWKPPWGIEYRIDHLNALVLAAVAAVAWLVVLFAKGLVDREIELQKQPHLYTLLLLEITGLFGITVTGDMFNLYVLLEIASFSAYALIAMGGRGAAFAAFRYVIFGTIGACAYLLSVGYLYILSGSLNMADLKGIIPGLLHSKALLVGFAFMVMGVGIKMGIFPLHSWLPDAYTLAPSAVAALLAPLFTKVGAYVIVRVTYGVFPLSFSVKDYPAAEALGWLAIGGVIFGCVMALAQRDLKRMLCYLIVAEMGYILMGVATGNRTGITGAVLHIVNDAFMMACLFTVVGAIHYVRGTRDLDDLKYLHIQMPLTSAVLVVGGLAVVGIPPLCGFFSKWYLILGAVEARRWGMVAVLLLSSLLNAIVFFRLIERAYLEVHPAEAFVPDGGTHLKVKLDSLPKGMIFSLLLLASALLFLGLFSGTIVKEIIYPFVNGL